MNSASVHLYDQEESHLAPTRKAYLTSVFVNQVCTIQEGKWRLPKLQYLQPAHLRGSHKGDQSEHRYRRLVNLTCMHRKLFPGGKRLLLFSGAGSGSLDIYPRQSRC
jgi:hypothetical protein